ncbi:MAG: AlwI family type II restriction endonuclease [Methanomassiliicoccales archaeon]|nr:MAG: AlwI family type II restriction endonuclease [Methanomassiliicoccales archaeon]
MLPITFRRILHSFKSNHPAFWEGYVDQMVKTPKTVTVSLQPRPRSPYQLLEMMKAVQPFDGVAWWEKDENGNPRNQIAVGNAIAANEAFNLIPKKEQIMQFRTYLTMNPPTLGFAYIDDEDCLRITDSGREVTKPEGLQTLFMRQLLKWQYPSCHHGGSGGKGPSNYPLRDIWKIHPFLCALRLCLELEYLSKEEVAAFIVPMRRDDEVENAIETIRDVRTRLEELRGAPRRALWHSTHLEAMRTAYREEIARGRYKKRQSGTNTVEEMLETKLRNSNDYADTMIRYFKFTGLFKTSSRTRRIVIDPLQEWKVKEILEDRALFRFNGNIDSREDYYRWFGNPSIPRLPWEDEIGYLSEILFNLHRSGSILEGGIEV